MLNNVVWDKPSDFTDTNTYIYQSQVQNFANAAADFNIHGAHMIWHSAIPPWMSAASDFVGDAVVSFMENHIAYMASEYPQVRSWNVVNEAISDNPVSTRSHVAGNLRDTIWTQEVGDDFIERAFQAARDAGVETLLYNDYGIDLPNARKTQAVLQLVKHLNDLGLIDGIGLQSHLAGDSRVPTVAEFRSNIAQFAALGLEVHITEFDIIRCLTEQCRDVTGPQIAYNLARACREEPACVSFTFWGVRNDQSWVHPDRVDPGLFSGRSLYPLAFDSQYETTPIFDAFVDAWQ
jgi:endo-1,4-beta-xylanase